MNQALTITNAEQLPVITQVNPVASMLSYPAWLGSLINAVSRNENGMNVWTRQPEVPNALMPTGGQREAIEARCSQLERMAVPGPEKRALQAIGKLVGFYATGQLNESQAAVKCEVYLSTVNDLPAWAVEEAVNRWFRGECGDAYNYSFAPSPAVLREIAGYVARVAAGQLILFRRILNAKALPPPVTEEQRAALAVRAQEIIRNATPQETTS
jgi:hypothetical protein